VCGFRSYGPGAQRLELTAPLAVVHADNSQGKTSLAEAVEFLFTGATTRRLLLGGSPSEFQDALRNAHLPPGVRSTSSSAWTTAPAPCGCCVAS